ncbi:uncharacterized protein EDB91DRAFT_1060253 [Suillus paluster]|uniref:uncharacterized protein n=1 Tax=Suillus paluster TaxID=48578 RepID=UPI001B85C754|nr:uncharacterized protein EDB91DRAFT_1060253 [Suillus paluster]KAG1728985.1 hypothetical protein EDB91DRAFT_1060253 [Suillus paluster]
MLKMAQKHKISFAPLKLSKNLKSQLPAWLHLGAPPKTYHKMKDACLHQTHKIESVKDMKSLISRLSKRRTHYAKKDCTCQECNTDRLTGCTNPHKCTKTVRDILKRLLPKFNTITPLKKDDLTLTHRQLEKNSRAKQQQQGEILFDPSITAKVTYQSASESL